MKFSNLSIGTRLKAGFTLVTGLAVILAFVAWIEIQRIGRVVTEINDSWMVSIVYLNDMREAMNGMRRTELRYVLAEDIAAWDKEDHDREAMAEKFKKAVTPYETGGISGPAEQKLYDEFKGLYQAHEQSWARLRTLARSGASKREDAMGALEGDGFATFSAAEKAISHLVQFNVEGAGRARDRSHDLIEEAMMLLVGMIGLMIAAGGTLAWWITRSITKPLHEAIGAAKVVASGDLSQSVVASSTDETGQLLTVLGEMQATLRSTIGGIRQSADEVTTASSQIAAGNTDLSARTEHQASNLQQTAASLEQLTATVANSANSSRQANQLASSAADLASQGSEVVHRVVETMAGISQSSKKIGDIIGVIDGIAFQTNILALNAAVEAARAGEQGRGFAVVAGEVRTLAQRSAQAAKEIKSLIQDSVERVDEGSELVQRAGATMTDTVAAVRKVTDLIGEISSAAIEQNSGIQQVNTAVTNLDQVTQQNAALVEESAAAANSLRQQADKLVASVGRFRLGTV